MPVLASHVHGWHFGVAPWFARSPYEASRTWISSMVDEGNNVGYDNIKGNSPPKIVKSPLLTA